MQILRKAAGLSYCANAWAHSRRHVTVMLLGVGFLAVLRNGAAAAEVALAPYQQDTGSKGIVSIEVEQAHQNVAVGEHRWTSTPRYGASGASAMEASPNTGANVNSGYASSSPRLDFRVNFLKTGVHYVWIRGLGMTGQDDSLHVGLNGAAVSTAARIAKFKGTWTWSRDTMDGTMAQILVPSVGVHTVNVWMREDGMVADKLVLTTDAEYTPKNTGPVASSAGTPRFQQDPGGSGLVSVELENAHDNVPAGAHDWQGVSPSGASGASAMEASPNTGANVNSGYASSSPRLDFRVNFLKTGVHYVWIRGLGMTGQDDSLHVGLNGAAVSTAARIAKFKGTWTWSRDTMDGTMAQILVPSVGVHTVNVWMREDGMVADKLVLTTDAEYTPKNTGPVASSAGTPRFQQDPGGSGLVSVELENAHDNVPAGAHDWQGVSPSGASGASAMEASPNTGANVNSGYASSSPRLDFRVNFLKTGVHYVWIRGLGMTGQDDSLHVGLNGAAVSTAARIAKFRGTWTWSRDTMDGTMAQILVPSVGVHTVNVWMREDGMVADKLVLTTDAEYTPKNTGPAESLAADSVPVARPDAITVQSGSRITINVMANDDGLSDRPIKISIQEAPSSGTAKATTTGEIQYQAESGFTGETSLTYRLTDVDGDAAVGSVAIDVRCNTCVHATVLRLSWRANPRIVDGYRVFYGPTAETAVLELSDLNILRGDVDESSPAVEYDTENDLGLSVGQQACFRVRAYRASAISGYSNEICATM